MDNTLNTRLFKAIDQRRSDQLIWFSYVDRGLLVQPAAWCGKFEFFLSHRGDQRKVIVSVGAP